MVISAIAAVAGAIMYWAIAAQNTTQNSGFRLSTVGVILMIAGGVGFVISLIIYASSNRASSAPSSTIDRTTKNEAGGTTELHEQRN
jgi:TRAP-type C4-dicarboxylate transport system permease small subunit